ncbi:helix-turn-helix transcriptional regulator [Christiangramia sp.]|uniref:helix-turn-helix domain-containing protein n=1 Tax=Christiangramia sp. TaxID=1931228 RepID=UPI00262DCB11|nr:helix-turn-helix transcriptional regulator [Christiangramia sp.]
MQLLRLKEVLDEKHMTGKVLAEKVGVSAVSITNIVKGHSFPKPDLLLKLAEALDVDIKDLFYSTKEKQDLFVRKDGRFIRIGEISNYE